MSEVGPLLPGDAGTELASARPRSATTAAKAAVVLKILWTWLSGRSERATFKDEEMLERRRATLSDSARRQAAQLRADQEAGRSAVGPWAPPTGSSRHLSRPSKVLAMVWRDGTGPRS
jgi:hypothetical protein